MKKILVCLFVCLHFAFISHGQSFEGQLTYSITIKGEHVDIFKDMLPRSLDIFFLGNNCMTRTSGGMSAAMFGDVIARQSEPVSYMVVHSRQTVFTIDSAAKGIQLGKQPAITLEGEETVNGYACKRYLVTFDNDPQITDQHMWVTSDLAINFPSAFFIQNFRYNVKGIDGVPVKIVMHFKRSDSIPFTFDQELSLSAISDTKPDATLFTIPAHYKVVPFSEKNFTGL